MEGGSISMAGLVYFFHALSRHPKVCNIFFYISMHCLTYIQALTALNLRNNQLSPESRINIVNLLKKNTVDMHI